MKTQPQSKVIDFGQYSGHFYCNLPDEYLFWVSKPTYSGKFYKSLHSMEKNWTVPLQAKIAAREELERRGFKLVGERWEK